METLIGVASVVGVLFLFGYLIGPNKNSDTSSSDYDYTRDMNDPNGWHFTGKLARKKKGK